MKNNKLKTQMYVKTELKQCKERNISNNDINTDNNSNI